MLFMHKSANNNSILSIGKHLIERRISVEILLTLTYYFEKVIHSFEMRNKANEVVSQKDLEND